MVLAESVIGISGVSFRFLVWLPERLTITATIKVYWRAPFAVDGGHPDCPAVSALKRRFIHDGCYPPT